MTEIIAITSNHPPCRRYIEIHWTETMDDESLPAWLAKRGLAPEVVYKRDLKGGAAFYFVPLPEDEVR